MKVWIRFFRIACDAVVAETAEEAEKMDWYSPCGGDVSDSIEVDHVEEVTADWVKGVGQYWKDYMPDGDPQDRTLAEIFGITAEPSGPPQTGDQPK